MENDNQNNQSPSNSTPPQTSHNSTPPQTSHTPQPQPSTPQSEPAPQTPQPVVQSQPISQPTQPVVGEKPSNKMANTENKVFASLSYISVLFIVPLIVRGEDDYIKFHAKQGMVLFGAELIVWFALFLIESVLTAISPLSGFGVLTIFGTIFWIVFVGVSLMGVYYAWMGKRWKIFLLSRIAEKIKI